jgi:hypothetical protein
MTDRNDGRGRPVCKGHRAASNRGEKIMKARKHGKDLVVARKRLLFRAKYQRDITAV